MFGFFLMVPATLCYLNKLYSDVTTVIGVNEQEVIVLVRLLSMEVVVIHVSLI